MTRQWQLTTAVLAALSLFVALIAGSALRPRLAAAALPEPAAWTHATHGGVQAQTDQVALPAAARSVARLDHSLRPGPAPTDKKPFHSMWMTKDRPAGWVLLSPASLWLMLPTSFDVSGLLRRAHGAVSAAAPVDHDALMRLCVIRC